jgi:uncharacterized protein YlxW (UPF0749 family)
MPDTEPTDGRTRLLQSLRRPGSRGQLTAAILLAILGFALVVQVQSNGGNTKYVGARQSDLIQLINQLTLASQRAQNEINQLQKTRDSLTSDTNSARTALQQARTEATTLGILAGTIPAQGPGVRITVHDPKGAVGTDQLLNGVEELRDAGAEAMEVNNTVRVVAETSFVDDPRGGVLVDGRRMLPPYTIEAIGDPHTLGTALNFSGGFIAGIKTVDGSVQVDQSRKIEIASTRSGIAPKYAQSSQSSSQSSSRGPTQ